MIFKRLTECFHRLFFWFWNYLVHFCRYALVLTPSCFAKFNARSDLRTDMRIYTKNFESIRATLQFLPLNILTFWWLRSEKCGIDDIRGLFEESQVEINHHFQIFIATDFFPPNIYPKEMFGWIVSFCCFTYEFHPKLVEAWIWILPCLSFQFGLYKLCLAFIKVCFYEIIAFTSWNFTVDGLMIPIARIDYFKHK